MSGPVTPVRVVIVHWNQPEECVATVDQLLYGSLPVRVTVVDNASERTARAELGAGLAERIDERLVEIIDAPTNLGFGPGANLGLRAFLERTDEGDWVFLAPTTCRWPRTRSRRSWPLRRRCPQPDCAAVTSGVRWCR
ncbi:MAG: hypothetical protein R2714_15755 [Microthrixaceae bacterium]